MDRDNPASRVPVNIYRIEGAVPGQGLSVEINYEGVINYQVRRSGGEYARALSQSPGLIESRGVHLAGSTHWVPWVGDVALDMTSGSTLAPVLAASGLVYLGAAAVHRAGSATIAGVRHGRRSVRRRALAACWIHLLASYKCSSTHSGDLA